MSSPESPSRPAHAYPTLERLLADPSGHIRVVGDALSATYGSPALKPDDDPLGGLIETVLSQHTSDVNSGRAYASLRGRFATWDDVRRAPANAIAEAIRTGGLAGVKSMRIKEILDAIGERYGSLSLDALRALPVPEARAGLTAMRGVGLKTASCVLLFNLGKPAFPVDTHVLRVSRRVGFVHPKAGPAAVQDLVEASVAPESIFPLHVNLIRHGRRICRAQHPRCEICEIRALCRYGTLSAFAPDPPSADPADCRD